MAINAFELFAKLSLDDDDFTDKLSTAMDIAGGAIAGATAAVVGFSKGAVDVGANFDKSMSQVAATMGKTVDEIQDLRDFAQEMGSSTAFSASQAADALNYMALAGYDSEQSMEMLPTVLNLAASGGMDLARASDMVTDASSALGLSFEDTTVMVDQMALASSKTNTSVEQLGDAILTVGGNAKTLSGGTQELAQVLGLLADNGIKGSEAGTHLRNIMLQLSPQTDKAVDAWDALGVSAYTADGKLRPLQDTFGDLNEAMADMSDQEKTDILSDMFGTTDLASVNALLATNADRWDEVYEAIGNSAGSAEKMANTQLDNLTGDITLFQSALEGVQIAISDKLTPTLRQFVQFGSDGLSRVTTAFNAGGLKGAMSEFGSILSDGIAMITDMLPTVINAGMQLIGTLVKGIIDNAPKALVSIADMGADILTYITNGLSDSINSDNGKIVNAIELFINKIAIGVLSNGAKLIDLATQIVVQLADGIANSDIDISNRVVTLLNRFVESIMNNIPIILEAGVTIVSAIFDGISENLPILLDVGVDVLTNLIDGIVSDIPSLIDTAISLVFELTNAIGDNLPTILDTGIDIILALINGIIDTIPALIDALPEIINAIIQVITKNLPTIVDAGITITLKLIDGIIDALPQLLEAVPQIIIAIITALTDNLPQIFSMGKNLLTSLLEGAVSLISKVGEFCGMIIVEIENYFTGAYKDLEDTGKNLISGLVQGMTSMLSDVLDTVADIGGDIKDKFCEFFGIHSPSKMFAEFGVFMMQGLEQGVDKQAADTGKNIAKSIESALPSKNSYSLSDVISDADLPSKIQRIGSKINSAIPVAKPKEVSETANGYEQTNGEKLNDVRVEIHIANLNASAVNSEDQVNELAVKLQQMIQKGMITA